MSVNRVILIGRLGQDPEVQTTKSDKSKCSFSLATTSSWKNADGEYPTTWHKCIAWNKQAELIGQYLEKGSQLYVEGRIDNRSYDDKDGVKKYISEIVVENFRFVGSKDEQQQGNSNGDSKKMQRENDDDDGLPF